MQQQLAFIDGQIQGINERSRDPTAFNPTLGPLQDQRSDLANEIAALTASLRAIAGPAIPGKLPMLPSGMTMGGGAPLDVTGKVQLEGQAQVSIAIKVDGPGQVTGQFARSQGNVRVGTTMPTAQSATGSRNSPRWTE